MHRVTSPIRFYGVPAFRPTTVIPIPAIRGRGFGDFNQNVNTGASIAQAGAATTVMTLVAMGSLAGPVGALVGAAAGALILVGSLIAKQFQGCGQTCTEATKIANQVSDLLIRNRDVYLTSPVHYRSLQAAALNNFDMTAAAMRQACGNPQLGDAGQRCIGERLVRGAPAPWCPSADHTGCDWITAMRDPIANDPHVVDDPPPGSSVGNGSPNGSSIGSSLLSSVGVNPNTTVAGFRVSDLVIPGLLFGAVLLLSND